MFKENLSILLYVLPALIVTYHASNLIDESYEEITSLREQVWELQNNCDNQYTNKISYKVTVTTYNPTRSQTDSTPNELAAAIVADAESAEKLFERLMLTYPEIGNVELSRIANEAFAARTKPDEKPSTAYIPPEPEGLSKAESRRSARTGG